MNYDLFISFPLCVLWVFVFTSFSLVGSVAEKMRITSSPSPFSSSSSPSSSTTASTTTTTETTTPTTTTKSKSTTLADLSPLFPPLLWVLRDFFLSLDNYNNDFNAYLESTFLEEMGNDSGNTCITAKRLRSLFKKRECFGLVWFSSNCFCLFGFYSFVVAYLLFGLYVCDLLVETCFARLVSYLFIHSLFLFLRPLYILSFHFLSFLLLRLFQCTSLF